MAELEYFPWYNSYMRKTSKLSDSELGRLVRALMTYNVTGEHPQLNGREDMAFDFMADDIDRAKQNYEERCQKNKANANKRADQASASERNRTQPNASDRCQSESESKSEYKSKSEYESNTPNGVGLTREALTPSPAEGHEKSKQTVKRFVPPTLEEVRTYCTERKNNVDAQRFVDFYEAKGWRIGKNAVRDWQACVRTWENGDNGRSYRSNPYSGREVERDIMQRHTPEERREIYNAAVVDLDAL